jgi:DNA-directed RNA polymerase specialized sigma24 family protein
VSDELRAVMEHFATTRWTLVVEVQAAATPRSRQALETLCDMYWYPLYAYLRRRGHSADDAQDLTQGFFASLLEHHAFDGVDRTRGRFRSFLLAALNHYVSNVRDRDRAKKRGGSVRHVPVDGLSPEERYGREPADRWTPEKIFDRNWALTLLERVLVRVRDDWHGKGKGVVFDTLKSCLTGDDVSVSYRDVGVHLAMTEGAVKQAVHRLRRSYRDVLYDEIRHTVSHADDVEAELRYLMAAMAP